MIYNVTPTDTPLMTVFCTTPRGKEPTWVAERLFNDRHDQWFTYLHAEEEDA